ncbi:hypothetical protein ERICIV_00420 [Paenibacillus larvae subsp. larvae]|uniref:Uncharacterized protein n=1 Tax=Paenibacillus larvae subsp. larvae TaxID=147375 RepID=A0A2L1U925_9BACL|nr:hypothetical protein [Paenibacillus larvae]AQT85346.1 hypothetical protein B1222_14515 [Paenibacillus larvae subsp. pulvifaciens]AQZ47346.1 hypothetical protein B5S25_12870 [Paenibacillus larvae subsp. pulvifaciens]AVF24656.1 hypothetical protein ERICIII_00420 [Paenibacillus larvae subsp. larvae]AVF29417.1 hypothetical protein ERICIV_00420 [Paenibacillus larvae subsp. larvae]MCY7519072.1 hypothetical protein [Paenibacillus larvae]
MNQSQEQRVREIFREEFEKKEAATKAALEIKATITITHPVNLQLISQQLNQQTKSFLKESSFYPHGS